MDTRILCLVLPLLLLSQQSLAHHSRAEFTGDVIELTGELIDISWRNPHPSFRIRMDDAANTELEIQAYGSIGTFNQTGVTQEMFMLGQQVTFAGQASNRRSLVLGLSALLPDGTEAILQYNGQPHWTGERVGGSGSVIVDQAQLDKASGENRGFFRLWNTESTEVAVAELIKTMQITKYTPAALAAEDNWDLTDNPITRCEPSWMPHTMIQPVDMEMVDNGDTITLTNFYYDSVRTIHMANAPATEQPLSRLGFSRGRMEGNTLVVETDRITAPAFNGGGILQSDEMRTVERFTLSADQSRLDYLMVMTDPVAFEEPAVFQSYYLALERESEGDLSGSNCD